MSSNDWIDVSTAGAVAEGGAIEVVVENEVLAIFRSGGVLFALDAVCAHQGGPIAQGRIENGCVTCPWHGWQYELATGVQTMNRKPLQRTFEVRENEGRIEVKLRDE